LPILKFILGCLYPLARFALFIARVRHGSSTFEERLGVYREIPMDGPKGPHVWLHAASAGEVNAILPLVKALRFRRPDLHLTITTTSRTGRKMAKERAGADRVHLAPLDIPLCLTRAFDSIRPDLYLVAETEFWPLCLLEAKRREVPTILVNGRVSNKSFPTYRMVRFLFRDALESFAACLVQAPVDRDRVIALGARRGGVEVIGQMKYDLSPPDPEKVRAFADRLGIREGEAVFTFGSLRPGEEEPVLEGLGLLFDALPQARVILAPRHFDHLKYYQEALDGLTRARSLEWALRSGVKSPSWRVLVLDTVGDLASAYALSRATFVGGTLVPIGGHNVMEPALSSVPVCFGPYLSNVAEAAEALGASGGGQKVATAQAVMEWMASLGDPNVSHEAGLKARAAVDSLRGATDRTAERVLRFLQTRSKVAS